MPDQNLSNDQNQNPVPGSTSNPPPPTNPSPTPRPNLTTEEVPATQTPPPIIPETTDVPPPPADAPGSGLTDTAVSPTTNIQPATPGFDLPPIVGAPPKKKFGGKKVISTILGLLLLIGGIGAGVTLVKQQQDIREQAAGDVCSGITNANACNGKCVGGTVCRWASSSRECKKTETKCTPPPASTTTTTTTTTVGGINEACHRGGSADPNSEDRDATFDGKCKVAICPNGDTDNDGTCSVNKDTGFRYGGTVDCSQGNAALQGQCGQVDPVGTDGTYCKTDSNKGAYAINLTDCGAAPKTTEPPSKPTAPPVSASAQCLNVKAYSESDVLLTTDELKALKAGDKVRFAVGGTATGVAATFDKAKFKINTAAYVEVTTKNASNEYYYELTIPDGTNSFNIKAAIHHTTLGWSPE